jgi:hypothetical protein
MVMQLAVSSFHLHINPLKPDSSKISYCLSQKISYILKSPVPTQQETLLLQSEDEGSY